MMPPAENAPPTFHHHGRKKSVIIEACMALISQEWENCAIIRVSDVF